MDDLVPAYLAGTSLNELARRYGVSRPTVRRRLVKAGVELRESVALPADLGWWRAQFDAGQGVPDIATRSGVTTQAVYHRLRRLGMPQSAPKPFDKWLADRTERAGACLRWTGAHTPDGYPLYNTHSAGRRVWEHEHGPLRSGIDIVHTSQCRFGDCVRLSHLRAIDSAAHRAELADAHRYAHGEQHWNAKLSDDAARYILHSGLATAELAIEFGVSRGTINNIRARRTWRHLT